MSMRRGQYDMARRNSGAMFYLRPHTIREGTRYTQHLDADEGHLVLPSSSTSSA